MSTQNKPNSALILVQWDKKDDRGPLGRVFEGGRKLVRMDKGVSLVGWNDRWMIQRCRITHDTQPTNPNAGVMFVTPVEAARDESVVRAEMAASGLEEVRAEWHAAWRAVVTDDEALQNAVRDDSPRSPNDYDRRWGKNRPVAPRLRVADGRAGVYDKEGQLLIPLPELGNGEELTLRVIAAWDRDHRIGWARKRLVELGVALSSPLPHRVETWGDTIVVIYQATVAGVTFDVATAKFWDGREGDLDVGSEIPEARAAMTAWVEEYFNRFHRREGDDVRYAGVVTTMSGTTATYEYVSNDERGMRIGGGDEYYTVFVDGVKVGTVGRRFWDEAASFLGLVEGGWHPGLSPRMLEAFSFAHRELTFGCLGPLGREAALAQAGVDFDAVKVKAEGERSKAEAEAAEARRQADEAQALREGLEAEARSAQADAVTLRHAKHFTSFALDLQRDIERVARGVGGVMSCRSNWQLKDWTAEARDVMSRANASAGEAKAQQTVAPELPPAPEAPPVPAPPATFADLQAKFGGAPKKRR